MPDKLKIKNKTRDIWGLPLHSYFEENDIINRFQIRSFHTGCYRGYFADWELIENKLFLTGLKANTGNLNLIGIKEIFNTNEDKVFAEWFTGIMVNEVEGSEVFLFGFLPEFDKHYDYHFKNGILDKVIEYEHYKPVTEYTYEEFMRKHYPT
ncbi:MAG: hypothetical protein JNJ56_14510 [Ignavibacteria bacterium]|nr:hypothetical protein [Ignavibacteria bacterium]